MTRKRELTAAGVQYRMVEQGSNPPGGNVQPIINQHEGAILFDKDKCRWNDEGHKYAYDGTVGYLYLPDPQLPRAYLTEPREVNGADGLYYHNPRCWLWGNASTLSEVVRNKADNKTVAEYTLRQIEDNGRKYELVLKDHAGTTQRVLMDPAMRCEVIRACTIDKDGKLRYEATYEYLKAPGGGWMPRALHETYYSIVSPDGEPVPIDVWSTSFRELQFGPVDPQEFSLKGLGVPQGTLVYDKRVRGLSFVFGVSRVEDKTIAAFAADPDVKQTLADAADNIDGRDANTPKATTPSQDGTTIEDQPTMLTLARGVANKWPWIVATAMTLILVLGLWRVTRRRSQRVGGK